ncbi:hypothetical protein KP509_1Z112300 [Ceratopteris richardii]|nr:hypothetical protein KP509_1Z112300 [Ceratopteris richardii]
MHPCHPIHHLQRYHLSSDNTEEGSSSNEFEGSPSTRLVQEHTAFRNPPSVDLNHPYIYSVLTNDSLCVAAETISCKPDLPKGEIVHIFCKKRVNFYLAVENDNLQMKEMNMDDEGQQWIKDDSYGSHVKDNYGYPAFSLVNVKTRKILKHGKEKGQQVVLIDYRRPEIKDDDILWSESQDFGEGFMTVRCASNTLLNLTVLEGAKSVRDGSELVLETWHKADHQLWKLSPLC